MSCHCHRISTPNTRTEPSIPSWWRRRSTSCLNVVLVGENVIRPGDDRDIFYVVESGKFDVSVAQRPESSHHIGGSNDEIADDDDDDDGVDCVPPYDGKQLWRAGVDVEPATRRRRTPTLPPVADALVFRNMHDIDVWTYIYGSRSCKHGT